MGKRRRAGRVPQGKNRGRVAFGSRSPVRGMTNGAAYLPGYEHDIFVSYAHEGHLGPWTVRLQEELKRALDLVLLTKLKGRPVDVWIDQILRNNLPLTDQLKASVEGSALLLIVMSPFYLGSPWCGNEVTWFAAAARSRVAPDRRIFVVHAMRTDRPAWPAPLAELTPYPFFARHPTANLELPLGLVDDKDDEKAFKAALYNLAGQIKQQIDELLEEAKAPPPSPVVIPFQPAAGPSRGRRRGWSASRSPAAPTPRLPSSRVSVASSRPGTLRSSRPRTSDRRRATHCSRRSSFRG